MQGIDIFGVPVGEGMLGISAIPGGNGSYEDDLLAIQGWGAKIVFSMTEMHELESVAAGRIADQLAAMKIDWYHLPIRDFGAPPPETQRLWAAASSAAHQILDAAGRVLVHCRGGCGRSGMAALRLLVERGENAETALERIRQIRPCAVETRSQYAWASEWTG